MTEVAMLHSKLHADTKFVNGKWLSVQGTYQDVRPVKMTMFPGMNCSRTFSARTQLPVCSWVYASNQEGFCWSLTPQQFGASGSVENKPELDSWCCCKSFLWFSHQMQSCLLSRILNYWAFQVAYSTKCTLQHKKGKVLYITNEQW